MATFRERTLKSGKTSVTAQITRRNPAYHESKTFDRMKVAKAWAKRREAEIDAEIAAGRTPKRRSDQRATLGDAIDKYVDESMREIGKTKAQVLRTIRREYQIAGMRCDQITAPDIVAFEAGLDRTYISGCERRLRNPSLISVEKIANALNVSAGELLGNENGVA